MMKNIYKTFLLIIFFSLPFGEGWGGASAQSFCFFNPNTGPHYHNGSAGNTYDIVKGDFNNDGHADIVTANSTASDISFLAGDGNGTLGSAVLTPVQGVLFCITAGDFNGDSTLDIAVGSSADCIILTGNGNGTFQQAGIYTTSAGGLSRIYCNDINQDNLPDVIMAGQNGIFVLINQGSGILAAPAQYLAGTSSIDIAVADFDNDLIPDIVSSTHLTTTTSALYFLTGTGSGSFLAQTTIAAMTFPGNFIAGIIAADFNNDGNADFILTNSSIGIPRIEVYNGMGNGTFNSPVYYPSFNNPFYIYAADFDSDTVPDIIVTESSGYAVFKGYANGTFGTFGHFNANPNPNALAIGDFNEDGKMDVIIPSYSIQIIIVNLNCLSTGISPTPTLPSADGEGVAFAPNPLVTQSTLTFSNPQKEKFLFTLYDITGRPCEASPLERGKGCVVTTDNKIILEKGNKQAGVYLFNLTNEKTGERVNGKIVVGQ